MPIVLVELPELRLTFDPVRADDTVPSVAFDVKAELTMPFQHATLLRKECWFSHDALNTFERALRDLLDADRGVAQLANLSENRILHVEREGNSLSVVFTMSDNVGMAETVLKFNGYASEVHEIHRGLSTYEKWW